MKRLALASFLVGAVAGCAASLAEPEQHAIPPAFLQEMARDLAKIPEPPKPLICWEFDKPMPERFVDMDVLFVDKKSRLFILGSAESTTLIGELVPGWACVLGEGAEA